MQHIPVLAGLTVFHKGIGTEFAFAYCVLFPSANMILRGKYISFTWETGFYFRTSLGQDLFITRAKV